MLTYASVHYLQRKYYNANIRGGALIVKKVQNCIELRNFGPQEIIQQKNSIHDIVCRIRGWNYPANFRSILAITPPLFDAAIMLKKRL